MRLSLGYSGRITAHATFYALVVLAFGLLVTLSGFVSYFAPVYDTCKSLWENLLMRASSLGVLLPATVAGSVVVIAGVTLIRQWLATRRLLRGLVQHRVPVPHRLVRVAQEVGLADRIECVSDIIAAPFCYGFTRPRICVPVGLLDMLDDSELRAVLRHEGYHVQSRDPLKIWLSRALARGLYFLPLARDLRDSYLAAKEVAADETTAHTDELPLASALIKMLSAGGKLMESAGAESDFIKTEPRQRAEAAVAIPGNLSVVGLISVSRVPASEAEERIRRLIDGRPAQLRLPSVTSVVLSAIIVIAIFAASYTNLSAVSVLPVSQECATETVLRQPQAILTIEGPAPSLETNVAPVVPAAADPGVPHDFLDCDLLTPSCP